ncbi:hypothetical protein PNOK_0682100 [Pyrrhoderma noxium]|uniref:Uncharacterized protein n=1 Tax=Pyrrhoderma noxium TaxID=2282107 RepID=A0A286UFS8_9AGAM|nr:hypothetical protein PNOK_0682100 [Pyrrhoderma noxium]
MSSPLIKKMFKSKSEKPPKQPRNVMEGLEKEWKERIVGGATFTREKYSDWDCGVEYKYYRYRCTLGKGKDRKTLFVSIDTQIPNGQHQREVSSRISKFIDDENMGIKTK